MRLITIFVLVIGSIINTFAQGEANSLKGVPVSERIVTGGGMGMGFGNLQDFVSISPLIGYSITKRLVMGSGFTYRYTKFKGITPNISFNDYSINPFARFTVYNGIFLQTEYEHLNYEYYISQGEKGRSSFNSFLGGGGFMQPIGNRSSFFAMALYNFSYTASDSFNTPYTSPWIIRVGFNVGGFMF
jgi:hypothetical protein